MGTGAVVCPRCGEESETILTDYGSTKHVCRPCGLRSWDYKPLVSPRTHLLRKLAHAAFDRLWRDEKIVRRGKAYRMLAKELGISRRQCHIGDMMDDLLEKVPDAARRIRGKMNVLDK